MNIAVFGAGYVGSVTAACLAELGHSVRLVESSPEKLELLRRGVSPVDEPVLYELIGSCLRSGRVVPAAGPADVAFGGTAIGARRLSPIVVVSPARANGCSIIELV